VAVQTERDPQTVGELIRFWRTQRRLTQMDLSLDANLSTKHLSFVETGHSRPSRQLLIHLAQHLDLPIAERNRLLLAGGFAPPYLEQPFDGELMRPPRESLSRLLEAHEPNPALIVDGLWNLIEANQAAALLWDGGRPRAAQAPINMLRLAVHPGGLPKISSMTAACNAPLITKLRRRSREDADPALGALIEDVESYLPDDPPSRPATQPVVSLDLRTRSEGQPLHRDRDPRGAARGVASKPRDRDLPADGRAQRSAARRAQCKGTRRMTTLPPGNRATVIPAALERDRAWSVCPSAPVTPASREMRTSRSG
jgi:transcriptional regulator with XRE-family HTH domain